MLLLGTTITTVVGNSGGAPGVVCAIMMPFHKESKATTPVPYTVDISSLDDGYVPGQNYSSKHCMLITS